MNIPLARRIFLTSLLSFASAGSLRAQDLNGGSFDGVMSSINGLRKDQAAGRPDSSALTAPASAPAAEPASADPAAAPVPPKDRNVLWKFAQCVDLQTSDGNTDLQALGAACSDLDIVLNTTRYKDDPKEKNGWWIMEDHKMTGCPADAGGDKFAYIHALAIPHDKVTGAEQQSQAPQDIWESAWKTGTGLFKIPESDMILAANPRAQNQYRSQDQLHIHIVRMMPDARQELFQPGDAAPVEILNHSSGDKRHIARTYVSRLSEVWAAAESAVKVFNSTLESGDYGIAVLRDADKGRYAVIVVDDSPEKDFVMQCPGTVWHP